MSDSEPPIGDLPSPPRLPRPMPDEGKAGWWVRPGFDPRVIRYYDGEDWTEFICRRGLRGPGDIERDPIPAREDLSLHPDPEIRALPQPPRHPPLADQQYANWEGWFRGAGADDSKTARYFHDRKPTDFVCDVIPNGAGPVYRRPYQPYKNR